MRENDIREFFTTKPGYLKSGAEKIAELLDANIEDCRRIMKELKQTLSANMQDEVSVKQEELKNYKNKKDVTKTEPTHKVYSDGKRRVLAIGDLHLPFTLDGYLEHCIKIYKKYDCNEVVFIGDILDLHFSSYHETHTDAFGATEELDRAIEMIKPWVDVFPKATVTIGNHDALIYRKAMTAGISKRWIQDFSVVLNTPGWNWVTDIVIDNVMYTHGTTNAYTKAKQNLMSTVQGHLHSMAGIQFFCGQNSRIFGFQIGAGIDNRSYAMEYGKAFAKPIISCGVVIDGVNPYLEVMEL